MNNIASNPAPKIEDDSGIEKEGKSDNESLEKIDNDENEDNDSESNLFESTSENELTLSINEALIMFNLCIL